MSPEIVPADTSSDRRAEKDRFLSEFALALAEGVDRPEFLQGSVRRIGEILGVDRVALPFFDDSGGLVVRSNFAAEGVMPLPQNLPGPWNLLLPGLQSFRALASEDVLADPRFAPYREVFLSLGTRSLLMVPISIDGTLRGILGASVVRAPRAWTESDIAFLESAARHLSAALKQKELLAEQAAIASHNARLIDELQRSSRLKDDFLANLSHEVRTPLTGIVGWAEVLLDSRGEDPQVRRALEAILGQADTLSRMLADLIDLSRVDNLGLEIHPAPVSLAGVIADALDSVSPGAAKGDVAIRCRIDANLPEMDGDAARLKQVVWNLLTNGVKFSPPGSTVDVIARRAADGGVELVVEDQGVGIDASFLPHVFERFRQEESSSNRRFGGLGVGLSIARIIVEAHGGTIKVASEGRARGARFTVHFPPKQAEPAETTPPRAEGAET